MIQRLNQFITDLRNGETGRFARFLIVGVTGTTLDFVLLGLLKNGVGLPTRIANPISYSAGIVNNFTLNRLWTFKDSTNPNIRAQFAQYFVINIGGLLLNTFIVDQFEPLFVSLMGDDIAWFPAKVIASLVAVIFNFLANRYITFRDVPLAGHDPVTPTDDTISESGD